MADELRHAADRRLRRRRPVKDGWTDIAQRIRDRVVARSIGKDGASSGPRLMRGPTRTATTRRWRRSGRGCDAIVEDPGDRRGAQAVVPPALQAAVLPRRIPAGLQRAGPPPGRHRRPGRRAHRRDRRLGRRRALRARLPRLRFGLRGRHSHTRPGYETVGRGGRDAVRALGRRHARACTASTCTASRTCSSSGSPGRQPDLEHHPQPQRGGLDDRRRGVATPSTTRRRARSRSPKRPSRPGSTSSTAASRAGFLGNPDCTPGYYNNEGQTGRAPRAPERRRLPAGSGRLLRVHRPLAE